VSWIKKEFGKIDILVNNAAVAGKGSKFDTEVFDFTFTPNVFGTIDFTETVIAEDLIKSNGKIIMIGSIAGLLKRHTKKELLQEFTDENLEVEKL
jgi:NAD(P)-dependent dehydrogenase (short-subunit alcohol dehydrogenase family)